MRIGIDIDNTIVCYDHVFAPIAVQAGFDVPLSSTKSEVKKWFHERCLEDEFTNLQGQVYGKCISMAHLFEGVLSFIAKASRQNHQMFLVSHKTKFPIIGEKINLHDAAMNFLSENSIIGGRAQNSVPFANVFFEPTIETKVQRIVDLDLDYFIDDLLSILCHKKFPSKCHPIWFSKNILSPSDTPIVHYQSWESISRKILGVT